MSGFYKLFHNNPGGGDDFEYSSMLASLFLKDDDDFAAAPSEEAAFFVDQHVASSVMLTHRVAPDHQPPAPTPAEVVTGSGGCRGTGRSRKRRFQADDDELAAAVTVGSTATRRAPSSSPSSDGSGEGNDTVGERGGGRRVWVRVRSKQWWNHLSDPACPEEEFRRAFRMPRAVFDKLCDDLAAAVAKEDTTLRAAIPVPHRVAVCIWRLATGEPLREVSRRFGLGISTCHNIILQVCAALTVVLFGKVVRWPQSSDSLASAASMFEAVSGIPGVVGAVHTEHIPIVAPRECAGKYYDRRLTERNQKVTYSVAMQAVVDANGTFTYVCTGPGSLCDATVLEKSGLGRRFEAGEMMHGELGEDDGQWGRQQPHRLVGGKSFPLTDWMLVPYAHPNLTWAQHRLNERVAAARGAARGAFRRLRARWRCLRHPVELKLPDLPKILGACCVLHNLCERGSSGLDADLLLHDDLFDEDGVVAADTVPSAAAEHARDRIAHDLLHAGNAFF
ncbi:hypothetical protein ABZP36_013013 [Zizania latifolia]